MKRIATAVIALLALMPLCALAATASSSTSLGSGPVKASVQINGVALGGVKSVAGLSAAVAYFQKHQKATAHRYGLTITKTLSAGDSTLSQWWKSARTSVKAVTVVFNNSAGTEVARVEFGSCIPTKWSASVSGKTSGAATEKIGLRCTGVSLGS